VTLFTRAALILLLWSPATAQADDRPDYVDLGGRGIASWRCAIFANMAQDRSEGARLFQLGYSLLSRFVSDEVAGKVTGVDWTKIPPDLLFVELPPAPSLDFRLGVLWQSVSHGVRYVGKAPAVRDYEAENCSLIR